MRERVGEAMCKNAEGPTVREGGNNADLMLTSKGSLMVGHSCNPPDPPLWCKVGLGRYHWTARWGGSLAALELVGVLEAVV